MKTSATDEADRALQACIGKGVPASIAAYGDNLRARINHGFVGLPSEPTRAFTRVVEDPIDIANQAVEAAAATAAH